MYKYFNNINTLEELRKQYKELLKKYHPDNLNGDVAATQEINAEYDKLFKVLKDKYESSTSYESSNKSDNYNNMQYDFANDMQLRDILMQIINYTGITIEIIGSWIWVDGNTYEYKDALKSLGFKWAREKKKWYWHGEGYRKKSRKKLSMDDIRDYYGSVSVQTRHAKLLNQT